MPSFAGQRGNPVVWSRRFFAELMAVTGDTGGRRLIEAHRDAVVEVKLGADIALDVDTRKPWRRWAANRADVHGGEIAYGPAMNLWLTDILSPTALAHHVALFLIVVAVAMPTIALVRWLRCLPASSAPPSP